MHDPRGFLTDLFRVAIDAARPERVLALHLPERPRGRTLVVGAGKAAASMAAALEAAWDGPLEGLVVTRYGHGAPTQRIEVVEASHPVPDAAGERAAARMLASVRGLTADDLVLCLISGGGSALLAAPAPGLTLEDKRAINKALLASGAGIVEMNCVRKHLSAIKGGRLAAAAAPARVVSLVISDVPGDDLSVIASGPTVPDPTTSAQALAILARYGIEAPGTRARRALRDAEARRPRLRAGREPADRRADAVAARGGRGGASGRRDAAHPGRRHRGRGARGRQGLRGFGVVVPPARRPGRAAVCAAERAARRR